MGNLLRVLQDKPLGPKVDFYVDFERAEPTEGEKEVYQQVAACLGKAPQVLEAMKVYKGAGQEIREVCLLHMKLYMCACVCVCIWFCP